MSENKYTNKDKIKELKKFFANKKKKNFSGRIIKPSKNYKGKIENLALPKPGFSFDEMLKEDKKRELQKKRYGREPKENELEVKTGGLITKKYANAVNIVDNLKRT